MTNSKIRKTIAILAAALLVCTSYAQARSSKPNPQALAKAAGTTANASIVVNDEVKTFLGNLAKGDEYTKRSIRQYTRRM